MDGLPKVIFGRYTVEPQEDRIYLRLIFVWEKTNPNRVIALKDFENV